MIERIAPRSNVLRTGQVLGYAEKGTKLDIAVLNVEGESVRQCEFLKFWSPHEAVAFFAERPKPLGIGTVETLALGTGREGWRAADFWIDEAPFHRKSKYDEFPFFWGPFQVHGGRSLAAIALLSAFRRRWPDLPATETAPGECFMHLVRSTEWPALEARIATLSRWLKMELTPALGESEWEAGMSAFAMWRGLRGDWPIDLHRLTRPAGLAWQLTVSEKESTEESYHQPAMSYETLIFPAGPVSFFWPPDERATAESLEEPSVRPSSNATPPDAMA